MRVIAVPVKPLEEAKRRLSRILSPAERAVLSLAMLEDVLDACQTQEGWEVWVVSRAEPALEVGARRGARPLLESGRSLLEANRRGRSSGRIRRRNEPLASPATHGHPGQVRTFFLRAASDRSLSAGCDIPGSALPGARLRSGSARGPGAGCVRTAPHPDAGGLRRARRGRETWCGGLTTRRM